MNFLNKEYEQLEEKIHSLGQNWRKSLEGDTVTDSEEASSLKQFPAIPQLTLSFDINKYESFIKELFSLLKESQPSLEKEIDSLENSLTEDDFRNWFRHGLGINDFYFAQFAKERGVSEWLPFFAAEHALRPYLQKAASELAEVLKKAEGENHCGCPSCGEPARLAVINKSGKKEMTCPRCFYSWEEKKISCAHCGNDEPKTIQILKIEKDETAEIHVCSKCKGYTKVIDSRKMIKVDSPQLMDIKSIHLDYIAQENGYGIHEADSTH